MPLANRRARLRQAPARTAAQPTAETPARRSAAQRAAVSTARLFCSSERRVWRTSSSSTTKASIWPVSPSTCVRRRRRRPIVTSRKKKPVVGSIGPSYHVEDLLQALVGRLKHLIKQNTGNSTSSAVNSRVCDCKGVKRMESAKIEAADLLYFLNEIWFHYSAVNSHVSDCKVVKRMESARIEAADLLYCLNEIWSHYSAANKHTTQNTMVSVCFCFNNNRFGLLSDRHRFRPL